MKLFISLSILACLLSVEALAGSSYYGGYHYGYPQPYRDADYYRLERNLRDLKRQQTQQTGRCQADLNRMRQENMQLIARLQGLGASLDSMREDSASNSEPAADQPGPSQRAYDDLQERYETLLAAYRALERDARSAP